MRIPTPCTGQTIELQDGSIYVLVRFDTDRTKPTPVIKVEYERCFEPPAPPTYAERQAACGLKVGDGVRVTREAKTVEDGWANCWSEWMNTAIGQIGSVIEMSPLSGVRLSTEVTVGQYWFPYFVLEKLAPGRNINGLTVAQVECDKGWRLITEKEAIMERSYLLALGLQMCNERANWMEALPAINHNLDFRTKSPLPLEAPVTLSQPDYGDMTGYRLLEEGEIIPKWAQAFVRLRDEPWARVNPSSVGEPWAANKFIAMRVPVPASHPLLTPGDFIKDGPWWVRLKTKPDERWMVTGEGVRMSMGVTERIVSMGGDSTFCTVNKLRLNYQRTRDGITWEDC